MPGTCVNRRRCYLTRVQQRHRTINLRNGREKWRFENGAGRAIIEATLARCGGKNIKALNKLNIEALM